MEKMKTMTNKHLSYRTLMVYSLILPFALFALLLTGCESGPGGKPGELVEEQEQITDGEDEENMTSEQSFPELTMPPIDQEVPENLETATLALG